MARGRWRARRRRPTGMEWRPSFSCRWSSPRASMCVALRAAFGGADRLSCRLVLARSAALAPRPRGNPVRFHGNVTTVSDERQASKQGCAGHGGAEVSHPCTGPRTGDWWNPARRRSTPTRRAHVLDSRRCDGQHAGGRQCTLAPGGRAVHGHGRCPGELVCLGSCAAADLPDGAEARPEDPRQIRKRRCARGWEESGLRGESTRRETGVFPLQGRLLACSSVDGRAGEGRATSRCGRNEAGVRGQSGGWLHAAPRRYGQLLTSLPDRGYAPCVPQRCEVSGRTTYAVDPMVGVRGFEPPTPASRKQFPGVGEGRRR